MVSFKSIVRELKKMKDGMGCISRRAVEGKRKKSHIAPDQGLPPSDSNQQSQWPNLPPELLLDIIRRVEESETSWPARAVVVFCASVCRSWREVAKEIVKTPEQCGRLTFPISLKQPGPREFPIQCFIRRDRATSTYLLFVSMMPSEDGNDKLMLAARKVRRVTCTEFVISLVANDFSRVSSAYVGKLRSNFMGTKFSIYDNQPPCGMAIQPTNCMSHRFHSKQVSPRVPAYNYRIGAISYKLNVLRARGPRRMNCIMNSIPSSSIEEGGTAPTPSSFPQSLKEHISSFPGLKEKEPVIHNRAQGLPVSRGLTMGSVKPLVLKNKAPRWHEQLQCWCLNFKGRVTVASVKNFQLVAAIDPTQNVPSAEQEKVILQFGKIGKDIFTMDYCYPLSAFQAFAICLSSFDTKLACE
ncbi:tubby-like F-box protein 5 [Mangifera indica]|uniref:tubby-like F-box protein 5 n=1 Tax=Mangifera indica TaxID=29780 RepID=UPI001CFAF009|nr:tubby-like F-box protein 5 [Mangifera indica]XP_044470589.1 tubby-like F-box protein 5 [Mangifera indica]